MPTRKIEDLLDDGQRHYSPLQRLLKTSADQKQWTAELRAVLEAPLKHEVEVTDVRGSTVYILCRSAASATKLRFILPEVKAQLIHLQSFNRVLDFRIRVSNQS